jgi:DNA-binding MarR family transcriptional regulator
MRDMGDKGRTGTRPGSTNNVAKLTESDVLAIRERAAAGEILNNLAEEYGVTSIVISKIVRGLSWKHVGGPLTNIGKGTRVGIFHGSDNRFAKFTEDDIRTIRQLAAAGEYTKAKIAKMYNTTDANISKIVLRQSWKHVD